MAQYILTHKKAQAWFIDFFLAILIVLLMLIFFFAFTANPDRVTIFKGLTETNEFITDSLVTPGEPESWDNLTVERIGLVNLNKQLNGSKVKQFAATPYNTTKALFNTPFDYVVYFTDENSQAQNVRGSCAIGAAIINTTVDSNIAYYFDDPAEQFAHDYFQSILQADMYSSQPTYDDFDTLMASINDYDMLVLENPQLLGATIDNYVDTLHNFSSEGNHIILTGQVAQDQGKTLLGANFFQKASQTAIERNASMHTQTNHFVWGKDEEFIFQEANYITFQNTTATNQTIATFINDKEIAVASWKFQNGSLLYFSDLDTTQSSGSFTNQAVATINDWLPINCTTIQLDEDEFDNLAKLERLIVFNKKAYRMIVYTWD